MTDQPARRPKLKHERIGNADGIHRDDTWVCELNAAHVFIKFYGPGRVEIGETVLDDAQHVLIRDGLCPLCD